MNTLRKLIKNEDITPQEYRALFESCIEGKDSKIYAPALMASLSSKPISSADVIHFVSYLHAKSPKKRLRSSNDLVNIVGTGGGISTFNISTTTVFVAAAAGAKVLKSGSYSYNSRSGSLDVLSELGIDLNLNLEQLNFMVEDLGLGFVSPRMYPPLLRRIATSILPLSMKDIGGFINTVGPLLCPIEVGAEVCGVKSPELIPLFSQALPTVGISRGYCVSAAVGMDEFSAIGTSRYVDLSNPNTYETFQPYDYQLRHNSIKELEGGSPKDNAELVHDLLKGKANQAATDTVIINAAFVCLAGRVTDSLDDAIDLCKNAVYSGASYTLLNRASEFSRDHHAVAV